MESNLNDQIERIRYESIPVSGGIYLGFTDEDFGMILDYMKAVNAVSPEVAVMNAISLALDHADD